VFAGVQILQPFTNIGNTRAAAAFIFIMVEDTVAAVKNDLLIF
jgi:hypothetical protein